MININELRARLENMNPVVVCKHAGVLPVTLKRFMDGHGASMQALEGYNQFFESYEQMDWREKMECWKLKALAEKLGFSYTYLIQNKNLRIESDKFAKKAEEFLKNN